MGQYANGRISAAGSVGKYVTYAYSAIMTSATRRFI